VLVDLQDQLRDLLSQQLKAMEEALSIRRAELRKPPLQPPQLRLVEASETAI
jgi:hypothetical protein